MRTVISVNINWVAKPREAKLIKEEGDGQHRREDDKVRPSARVTNGYFGYFGYFGYLYHLRYTICRYTKVQVS